MEYNSQMKKVIINVSLNFEAVVIEK